MNGSLRPGASSWRRAATMVLAAGWARPGPAAPSPPPPPAEGFRLLLLQRSESQGFLPGAHVFPGGVLDKADHSPDWLRLFAPHHGPPRFGLGPPLSRPASFPGLPDAADEDGAALPDDVAFRICAIREAFEEAGVLLLRPRAALPTAAEPARALAPPPGLDAWRDRVRRDPRHFLSLCAHLDCTPDIWALHDWGGWLTPFTRSGGRRFSTAFFLCCLREPPPVYPDLTEVVSCQDHTTHLGACSLLLPGTTSGDELYLEDSDFVENVMSTEKKTGEIMKEGKTFHRMVLHSRHVYSVHVTVQSKHKHVYPKTYVVSQSHL
ncbi:acyl-coenzyme A diphosphatase NUDT19 isoform X2 [Panthera pardus]|uniref:Acyl-coenzyme A diphosphatase NUDT19 isoform X2 n=1 Tax=Panthera pardus TaxID=9691 RepID=A0A9V1ECU2_PANPR|nr:acyl-coenzyme A diphosphatase NUDT19 isoform X2 [Panthera pardus]